MRKKKIFKLKKKKTINSVNPLYLIIDIIKGYIVENNRNKYFTLVPNDESKDKDKKNVDQT